MILTEKNFYGHTNCSLTKALAQDDNDSKDVLDASERRWSAARSLYDDDGIVA